MKTKVAVRRVGDVAVVDVKRKLEVHTVEDFLIAPACRLIDAGQKKIVVNLAKISHMDEYGDAGIFTCYSYAIRKGAALRLCGMEGLPQATRDKLKKFISTFDTEEQAVSSFRTATNSTGSPP